MNAIETLTEQKVVAIFRGNYRGKWQHYAEALLSNGVCVLEITLNSPDALAAITQLKHEFGERITLGAGTVLNSKEARAAIDAGAAFIVAPDTDPIVIQACRSRLIPVLPGAYTATEVKTAYKLGAAMVKLFPATSPEYVQAIHQPLNHIPLLATGGVKTDNVAAYLKAGAKVVGVGGFLTGADLALEDVAKRAKELVAAIQQAS